MERNYAEWGSELAVWRVKLRHLKWVAEYRIRLLGSQMNLNGINVLDCGSGPQFCADLLRQAGAKVLTIDKYAPCDIPLDLNEDFTDSLAPQTFDLVLMGAVIRYIDDKQAFFSRIPKLMSPTGKIFLDEFVYKPWNEAALQVMGLTGCMEVWPKENFTPIAELEDLLTKTDHLRMFKLFSCWPHLYLEGNYGLSMWHSMFIEHRV